MNSYQPMPSKVLAPFVRAPRERLCPPGCSIREGLVRPTDAKSGSRRFAIGKCVGADESPLITLCHERHRLPPERGVTTACTFSDGRAAGVDAAFFSGIEGVRNWGAETKGMHFLLDVQILALPLLGPCSRVNP